MEYAISIVLVHEAFNQELDWRDHSHLHGEEKASKWLHSTETTHDEEEELDQKQQYSPVKELIEYHSQSSVQNCTMLE